LAEVPLPQASPRFIVRANHSAAQGAQLVDDFGFCRKSSFVVLREHLLTVGSDEKDPAAPPLDLALDSELVLDRSRQTGGPREVISNAAVVDADVHVDLPVIPSG
jgi:hypothetical protein